MINKCLIIVILGILQIKLCMSQPSPSPNRVVILGTKHNGNKKLTAKSLLSILKKINPDIILLEFDSTIIKDCSITPVRGARTAEFLGIWHNPIEYRAARKYKAQKKTVCIAPFDIYIPNRKNYITYTSTMEKLHIEALNKLSVEHKLSSSDADQFNQYSNLNNAFLSYLDSSIEVMNRNTLSDTIYQIISLEKTIIKQITQQYNDLQPFGNWFQSHTNFWEERNAGICHKIARELYANSGRTILILTGLMHKYALEKFLHKEEMANLCKLLTLEEAFIAPPIF